MSFELHLFKGRDVYALRRVLPLCIAFLLCSFAHSQVVINEIFPDGTVELKNVGNTTVEVADYWLCDFPAYQRVGSSNLVCDGSSTLMEPGSIIAVDDFNFIDGADGELGLYTSNSFADANAIVDYVQWGSGRHRRASVAVTAGILESTDVAVDAFGSTESLAYDGDGDAPDDWQVLTTPTICGENSEMCEAVGGEISGGPFEFTVGDDETDMLEPGSITLMNNQGENSQWVVTDDEGYILGLPPMPSVVNFNGAGPGTCLIWHLSYDGEISGLEMGMNANDLMGCWSLSNSISVIRTAEGDCQANGGSIFGGPFEFTVGDDQADMVAQGSITLANSQGENSQWVVTDDEGYILGLPPMPSAVNFDGAGPGTCLIWHLSYDGEISGAEVGMNANDIEGCWSLSNSIEVVRTVEGDCQANGGEIFGGPFAFTAGDGEADMIPEGSITVANSQGENFQWIVTDDEGNILGLPPMPSVVNFDGAGAGTCLIWYSRYDGEISGLEVGANANDIEGCFALSNAIEVVRTVEGDCQANGGEIFGGPFAFTVGDGEADMIPEGSITVANSQGENFQWIVTDDEGNILGLPPMPSAVNFDGAGAGTCLIWYSRYDGEISGLEVGANANDIEGCFALSNAIEVVRTVEGDCQANGGEIFGGPFAFTVGDGEADMIPEGSITVANSQGENFHWIVTDDEGNILGLPPMPSAVNFDGAGPGTCLIWHLSYDGEISGAEVGMNANDIEGCWSLSNSIEVVRTVEGDCQANGGEIFGGPFAFTAGDGEADMIPEGSITVANSQGENFQWIVTDDEGNILGLPPMPSAVNFDGAGAGTCLIWYSRYDGEISELEVGANANDIEGCFALSNAIEVVRTVEGDCQANGGEIFGGPFAFTVGDGEADMIPEGSITVANSQGENFQWIVTDDEGNILGLPPMPSVVNFDGAGAGTCLIWYSRYDGEISGLEVGANANDIEGCFALSNAIEVVRTVEGDCQANGGEIFGGPFAFTVGDGEADMIPEGSITVANSQGENFQWIVTDDEGNILGLPPMPSVVNFDGAGAGTCLIWYSRYDGEISGLEVGANANDIEGCFALSNAIEVVRTVEGDCQANGGEIFGGPFAFTVGDGEADMIPEGSITVANSQGENFHWIVTDDEGNILGLPPMPSVVNFDGAGAGTCLIWYSRYDGEISGLEVGLNANDIEGCFALSNAIEVVRTVEGDCQANGGEIFGGPFAFTVGDGEADMIPEGSITVANSQGENFQWIVTDDEGNILGLPPMPSVVNFDGAGAGTCLIWYSRYDGEISGLEVGANANDIEGCFALSNAIEVVRTVEGDCQANGGEIFGGPFAFTVGDGEADMIPEGSITVANSQGENFQWIVTDDEGNILGLPPMPSVVNFDGAGAGTCLIWYSRYDGEISGLEVGANANDIEGCFALSNAIEVVRTVEGDCQANGGEIFGGPFAFTAGDGEADMIPEGSITVANSQGENFQWIVTDDEGNILGLPPMPSAVNFDGAGAGTCLIWYSRYDGEISGLEVGLNANDIEGCFALSNAIEVVRTVEGDCQANGGEIFGGPFAFTVGDGEADMIPEGSITVANSQGENFQWIVTDDEGNILGLPPMPSVVNFDGAGAGTCLIWYSRYDGEISGLEVGANANDIEGCFALSNAIEVVRTVEGDCQANGGEIFGGPFAFTVGDGEADMIPEGSITVANSQGENFQWIVTDDEGNILGLPPMPSVVNFDGAGAGTCLIWYSRYDGEISGLEVGANANDIEGCFALSNAIEVVRTVEGDCQANGGEIFGGPFAFTVGDGEADMIPEGSITVANSQGENFQWIVTDDEGNILGLPPMPSAVNFDGAGAGTCLIWYSRYDDEISGLEVGLNANDIEGCFALSNAIEVVRTVEGDCQANGGEIFGGPFAFTVGNGEADMIPEGSITVANSQGENFQWIVTDDEGNILGLPPMPSAVNFDGAGAGTCLIWYSRYDGEISGLEVGANANDIEGCFALSNAIEVVRTEDSGSDGVDVELSISAPSEFTVFESFTYTLTLTNNGSETATGIEIEADIPENTALTGINASKGEYGPFFQRWNVETLAPGETATLEISVFPLLEGVAITNFVEVIAMNEDDVDSTPGNGNDPTPVEDDEAVAVVQPDFVRPSGGITADLELSIHVEEDNYTIYEDFTYNITLVNDGPDVASNIIVSLPFPEGMVYSGSNTDFGRYGFIFQQWEIPTLAPGETATLDLTLFPLVENTILTLYGQVDEVDQDDPDSTPGNGVAPVVNEDDEAVMGNSSSGSEAFTVNPAERSNLSVNTAKLYPVPAINDLNLEFESLSNYSTEVRIMDMKGQNVLNIPTNFVKGFNRLNIDISALTNGKYYLVFDNEAMPFVVQNN